MTRPAATILLVEDKDSLRTMLRHALEAQGHQVVEARDQPEAVQKLAEGAPSEVIRRPQVAEIYMGMEDLGIEADA